MTFGEKIKELRKSKQITQEKLAELLSISPQAVSRWECDAAMPDISLLPPLAHFFEVSTDYLLDMDDYQKNLRKAKYDKAFENYYFKEDKIENYLIAEEAVNEYPFKTEYVEWLANAEYFVALEKSDEQEFRTLLERSISHHKFVYENSEDYILKGQALEGIVFAFCELGEKKKAQEWASLEADEEKRNKLLPRCLEGEEQRKLFQKLADNALCELLCYLERCAEGSVPFETIEKLMAVLFPDGNYQSYHNIMQYSYIKLSKAYLGNSSYDEAIEALKKSRYHAERMTEYNRMTTRRFTAPLFDLLSEEKEASKTPNSDIEDYIKTLNNNKCFDVIRNRKAFKDLLQQK